MKFFSQRRSDPPARYIYNLSSKVRSRILNTLQQHDPLPYGHHYNFQAMLGEVQNQALTKYGGMRASPYEAARTSHIPIIEHFVSCPDNEALDFIEMCFRTQEMGPGEPAQKAVEAINRIFEEEGVGYELTGSVCRDTGEPVTIHGQKTSATLLRIEYPKILKKGDRTTHEMSVKPALEALTDPRFAVANNELLKAFEEVRKGGYADAITSCGSAFESVLRTICDLKGWSYDPSKDTCSPLVENCRGQGLFPPFYAEIFKAVGTIRNKMGDAHGKGPSPMYVAGREHAEHMIAMTCSHICFIVRLLASECRSQFTKVGGDYAPKGD